MYIIITGASVLVIGFVVLSVIHYKFNILPRKNLKRALRDFEQVTAGMDDEEQRECYHQALLDAGWTEGPDGFFTQPATTTVAFMYADGRMEDRAVPVPPPDAWTVHDSLGNPRTFVFVKQIGRYKEWV